MKRKMAYKRNIGRKCELIKGGNWWCPNGSVGIIREVRGSWCYMIRWLSPYKSHGTQPIQAHTIKLLKEPIQT